jgi:hypothetical protein
MRQEKTKTTVIRTRLSLETYVGLKALAAADHRTLHNFIVLQLSEVVRRDGLATSGTERRAGK